MGHPTTTPRLHDIDPSDFAAEVETIMWQAATALLAELGVKELHRPYPPIRNAAVWLGWFAKTGQGDARQAVPMLERVEGALFRRPIDIGEVAAVLDYETTIGVVIGAARARVALSKGQPVLVADLASLAGYASSRIREAIRKGELHRGPRPKKGRAMDSGILAKEARAWLEARHVPGFDRASRIAAVSAEVLEDNRELFQKLAK